MFILDDIVLRSLGVKMPPPFDTLATLEAIEEATLKELYNPEKINNRLKEISLLLDRGEIRREEFEKEKEDLLLQLSIADKVKERGAGRRQADVKLL